MKYIANPVEVDAFVIREVSAAVATLTRHDSGSTWEGGGTDIVIDDDRIIELTPEMTARYTPVAGDYYVVQEDGYAYVNPKAVFERKYLPAIPEGVNPLKDGDTSQPDNAAGA